MLHCCTNPPVNVYVAILLLYLGPVIPEVLRVVNHEVSYIMLASGMYDQDAFKATTSVCALLALP
jgi:hypothetical protein